MQKSQFSAAWQQVRNPQTVVLAAMSRPDTGHNLITLEWFMRTSITPPMLAISIGHTRYSYQCLQQTNFFNVVFLGQEQAELARQCGRLSGQDTNKMELEGVNWFKGRLAGVPVLRGAAGVFECELVTQVKSGDHTIFVGQVKHCWQGASPVLLAQSL